MLQSPITYVRPHLPQYYVGGSVFCRPANLSDTCKVRIPKKIKKMGKSALSKKYLKKQIRNEFAFYANSVNSRYFNINPKALWSLAVIACDDAKSNTGKKWGNFLVKLCVQRDKISLNNDAF